MSAFAIALALLVAPAPAGAADEGTTGRAEAMRTALADGDASTRSFSQDTQRCLDDASRDTIEFETGDPEDEPRADIVEHCANFGPSLSLNVTVAEPTEPEEDAGWHGGTFVGWFLDVTGSGEGDFFVDYSLDSGGKLGVRVSAYDPEGDRFVGNVCAEAVASFTGAYSVSNLTPECLDLDDGGDIGVSVAIFYDTEPSSEPQDEGVFFDTAPGGEAFTPVGEGDRAADRLWGATRIETSIAISQHEFPTAAAAAVDVVYLARAFEPEGSNASPDAVAGGVLSDGPIILVPSQGDLPDAVTAEIDRLGPNEVIALGGPVAISDGILAQAAAGRQSARLAGITRIETAIAISQREFGAGEATDVYLARAHENLVDAVVGGVLTDGPILLVPTEGPVSAEVRAEIDRVGPDRVLALGGAHAIADATLAAAAGGREAGRLAGDSRFATAIEISRYQFPTIADELYLARADVLADAVAGGVLTGGPILLVESDITEEQWDDRWQDLQGEISRVAPERVYALGGPNAISDRVLRLAVNS